MKKIFTIFSIFISLFVYSQNTTVGNGIYIANEKGQDIRLIIKDNQYDLSLMSGKFEVKNDSILLSNSKQKKPSFDLVYSYNQAKSDKIKVNLQSNVYNLENVYIATFKGNETPLYKRVGEVKIEEIVDVKEQVYNNNLVFEINRNEFLVLVKDGYQDIAEMSKFKLPENVSEISISVQNYVNGNLKLSGIYNQQNKELTISENGRNPLVFKLENKQENALKEEVIPIETKKINNWTYPGKEATETVNPAIDAATETVNGSEVITNIEKPKFQLIVENNLKTAISSNAKTPKKFLVIYHDPKNKNAKSDFNNFITEQNTQLNYNMYDEYDQKYDLFNYYLASNKDEKWLKSKNITTFPVVIAINSSGDLLSQSNSTLFDLQNQFSYYKDFSNNITRSNVLVNFKKAIVSKLSDPETIKAFADLSEAQLPNENEVIDAAPVDIDNVKFTPPTIIKEIEPLKEEEKEAVKEIEDVKVDEEITTIETPPTVEDIKLDLNIYVKPIFDKKQVQTTWKNLIEAHKNDIKPNIDLVVVIIKELNGNGFTKQLFNEEKIIDQTNSLAFDYLFKHFNAIEQARLNSTYNVDAIHNIDLLENAIQYILNGQIKLINPQTPVTTQQKIIGFYKQLLDYKKLATLEKIEFSFQNDYFELLKTTAINSKSEKQFVQEYDDFHNKLFDNKNNIIETLDNLFKAEKGVEYESETWTQFKNGYANSANNASWYVVEHSKNPESIKKAIKWSEHSLKIEKNNHYYLDTLAQLYYLNGEKQKAIETQQLAIDNNFDDANEYKATLQKMKNGTY